MKNNKFVFALLFVSALLFQSCTYSTNLRQKTQEQFKKKASHETIVFYAEEDKLPDKFIVIAELDINSEYWSDAKNKFEKKARDLGADAVKITSKEYMFYAFPVPATKYSAILIKYDNKDWDSKISSEKEAKQHYDKNKDNLSPIEGIWSINETVIARNMKTYKTMEKNNGQVYRIAVIADTIKQNYEFAAYIVESKYDHWKPGMLKACFRPTAYPMIFEGLWFLGNMSEKKETYVIDEYGLITQENTYYEKQYPEMEFKQITTFLKAYPPYQDYKPKYSSSVISSGSGCMISKSGIVFTNFHVIENKTEIECYLPEFEKTLKAKVLIKDKKNDLALLKIDDFKYNEIYKYEIPFKFKQSELVSTGTETFTLGFPLGETLGKEAKLSKGVITSTKGLQDDPVLFQIDNPIQPGNSGGPLFDKDGNIVGIIVASLNAKFFYENSSIIPQNVNFAIKSNYLLNLISMLPEDIEINKSTTYLADIELTEQIKLIRPFIVTIYAK